MAFFTKLKDRLFKSSSKIDEGLEAIVSDGGERPYRLKVRPPSFCNLQALRDLDGLSSQLANAHDAAVQVLVEGAALHIQADLKWLDLCEAHLLKEGTDD